MGFYFHLLCTALQLFWSDLLSMNHVAWELVCQQGYLLRHKGIFRDRSIWRFIFYFSVVWNIVVNVRILWHCQPQLKQTIQLKYNWIIYPLKVRVGRPHTNKVWTSGPLHYKYVYKILMATLFLYHLLPLLMIKVVDRSISSYKLNFYYRIV